MDFDLGRNGRKQEFAAFCPSKNCKKLKTKKERKRKERSQIIKKTC